MPSSSAPRISGIAASVSGSIAVPFAHDRLFVVDGPPIPTISQKSGREEAVMAVVEAKMASTSPRCVW
jgi:hypothetical protein